MSLGWRIPPHERSLEHEPPGGVQRWGVAIAITLLVLEINVPESRFEDLWKGIVDQWPSYLAYATSFITIGGLWLAHHATFRRLASADGNVMRLNILLLMLVAFLPFPTTTVTRINRRITALSAELLVATAARASADEPRSAPLIPADRD